MCICCWSRKVHNFTCLCTFLGQPLMASTVMPHPSVLSLMCWCLVEKVRIPFLFCLWYELDIDDLSYFTREHGVNCDQLTKSVTSGILFLYRMFIFKGCGWDRRSSWRSCKFHIGECNWKSIVLLKRYVHVFVTFLKQCVSEWLPYCEDENLSR